jgi:hypothetical protein
MKYLIKHKNKNVMEINIDENNHIIDAIYEIFDEERAPCNINSDNKIKNIMNLNSWLERRSIPSSRENVDKVLQKYNQKSTVALQMINNGLSLTDHYWFCKSTENLNWNKYNFFDNEFSTEIGEVFFKHKSDRPLDKLQPDSSLNGMLKKRWIIKDGLRYLQKGGTGEEWQEPFNEVFASNIMNLVNVDHVEYKIEKDDDGKYYSLCTCMVDKNTEYLNAHYVLDFFPNKNRKEINDYEHFIKCCENKGIQSARNDLEKMIGIDYLIVNTDRHHGNFGIIRNANNLKWLKICPVFDSGTSLWCDRTTIHAEESTHSSFFPTFAETNEELIKQVKTEKILNDNIKNNVGKIYWEIIENNTNMSYDRKVNIKNALGKRVDMLAGIEIH